jgi:hypothetical protein
MKQPRRIRPLPPSFTQCEMRELVDGMSLDQLRIAHAVFTSVLDAREGRTKYRLPDHVQRLLN